MKWKKGKEKELPASMRSLVCQVEEAGDRVAGLQLIQLTGEEAGDALVHLDFGVVSRRCEGDRNTEYQG
jgi:hypothetical protein